MSNEVTETLHAKAQLVDILHILSTSNINDPILQMAMHRSGINSDIDILEKIAVHSRLEALTCNASGKIRGVKNPIQPSMQDRMALSRLIPLGIQSDRLVEKYMRGLAAAIDNSNKTTVDLLKIYTKYAPSK